MKKDVRHGDSRAAPSEWVLRHAPLIRDGGRVLDVACGAGRHARWLAREGFVVTAADIDLSRVADLRGRPGIELVEADLESEAWPFAPAGFDGIVVTNYLHRPHFPLLIDTLAKAGVLIFDTFSEGHERYGKPSNPDYLLRTGELMAAFSPGLRIIACEISELAGVSLRQRICAIRD